MKSFVLFLSLILLTACNEAKQSKTQDTGPESGVEETAMYPPALQQVLDAHGGLKRWQAQKTLSFQIGDENGSEIHTIDLWSRMDRVDGPSYSLGFDGEDVWLADSTQAYEGNPVFYHNLIFYFYAMPFVLADEGIIYEEAEALVIDDKSYQGIRIGYESGVGTSPKDEYFMYYDPDTYIMTWLGYTVTYFSGEPSADLHWIRYDDWIDVSGLLLPKEITWYNYEGRTIKDARETVKFEKVSLSDKRKEASFYEGPPNAKAVDEEN